MYKNRMLQLLHLATLAVLLAPNSSCTKTTQDKPLYTNAISTKDLRDSLNENLATSRHTGITRAVSKVSGAVVGINVTEVYEQQIYDPFQSMMDQMMQNDPYFRQYFGNQRRAPMTQKYQLKGLGSGFLISSDGYILTNDHVAGKATKIIVTTTSGKQYDAKLVDTDPVSDIALLKIEATDLPYVTLGNSDDVEVGEWAIAIGNPFGLFEKNNKPTVTVGVISNTGVNLGLEGGKNFRDMIQTDAAISSGNSGGPLLNINGEVIGMNATIFSTAQSGQGAGSIGLGFAIPVNKVKKIVDQFRSGKKVARNTSLGFTGQTLDDDLKQQFGITAQSGVLVISVSRGSVAERAGIEAGDVITTVNNESVRSEDDLYSIIADKKVGDVIAFNVTRGDIGGVIRIKLPPPSK
jgi:serine protease Do